MNSIQYPENPPSGKRKLILDTALGLFVENGYLSTKMIDIANAAEIGKGTIYEYYSSKEALFTDLLQLHVVNRYARMKEEIAFGDASCREQLRRYILFDMETVQRFGNGKNFIDQLYQELPLNQYPDLKKSLGSLLHYRLDTLTSIIAEGIARGEYSPIEPKVAAFTIMGAIGAFISCRCGLFSEYHRSASDCTAAEVSFNNENYLLEMLLHGLSGNR